MNAQILAMDYAKFPCKHYFNISKDEIRLPGIYALVTRWAFTAGMVKALCYKPEGRG
jgi:hypothetical protein